ncbi:MAG: hypothetical protein G5701_02905 [Serratia symbiotica]|nr:hypothetical protein [Serratia symbiotica]
MADWSILTLPLMQEPEPVHLAFAILPPIQQVALENAHHPQPAGIIDQLIQHY